MSAYLCTTCGQRTQHLGSGRHLDGYGPNGLRCCGEWVALTWWRNALEWIKRHL